MMIYLRYTVLAVVTAFAVTVALANRDSVTLALWPDSVTAILGTGFAITLPLFIVVGLAFGLGLLFGLGLEWLRERGIRAEAAKLRRQLEAVGAQTREAGGSQKPQDEILALVEPERRTGT